MAHYYLILADDDTRQYGRAIKSEQELTTRADIVAYAVEKGVLSKDLSHYVVSVSKCTETTYNRLNIHY
jgi:hypothetical protein